MNGIKIAYLIGFTIIIVALGALLLTRSITESFQDIPPAAEDDEALGTPIETAQDSVSPAATTTATPVDTTITEATVEAEPVAADAPVFGLMTTKPGIHLYGSIDSDTAKELLAQATQGVAAVVDARPEITPAAEIAAPGDDPAPDSAFSALVTGTQPERCSTRKISQMEQMIREDQNTLQVLYNRIFGKGVTPAEDTLGTPDELAPPVQAGITLSKTNLFRSIRNTNTEDLEGCIAPADLKNYIRKDRIPCYGCTLD